MPAQWRLVTNPATRAAAGELMAANSISSTRRGERHLGDLVLRGECDQANPDGDLQRKDRDHDPDQPSIFGIRRTWGFSAHVCRLFRRMRVWRRDPEIPRCARGESARLHLPLVFQK